MMVESKLLSVPLFSSCSVDDVAALLCSPHKLKTYRQDMVVMRQGEACLSLMVLLEGRVESSLMGDEGREVVVEQFAAPQLLAPAFLFASDNAIPVEVRATMDAEILFINREGFFTFMQTHPDVLRQFLEVVSDRGRFLSSRMRSFATQRLQERVREYLRTQSSIGSVAAAARMLGVARPSLSRVLAEMTAMGLVVKTPKGYILKS